MHREKEYRKVKKRVPSGALNHSFCMGGVIKINMWPIPENTSKMLPKRLPKRSQNPYKCVSGRLQKNTPKLDASNRATCSKTPPKMDPKTDQKSMKKHIWAPYGTTGPHYGLLGQALGVPLAPKCTKIDRKHVSGHARLVKNNTISANIPWETAVRKLTTVASLQLYSVLIKPLAENSRWSRPRGGLIKPVSGNSQ